MGSRVMISPVVEPVPNELTSKAAQYCDLGYVNFFPSDAAGRNASTWVMTLGRASDWTAASADPDMEFLFPIPAEVNTSEELRAYLRATTYGDLTVPQKTSLQAIFVAHAINLADFITATTLAKIVQRVASTLYEKDYGFGMGFHF